MIKALYYIRLNAAFIFALVLALPFSSQWNSSRNPASTSGGLSGGSCFSVMRESLARHGGFTPRGPALMERIPQFDQKIARINDLIMTPKAYARKFKVDNGRQPKIREMLESFVVSHNAITREIKNLNEGISEDREIAYYVKETLVALKMSEKEQDNLAQYAADNPEILDQAFDPSDNALANKMEQLWKNPYGDFGELLVALRTPGVEVQNLHFRIFPDQEMTPSARRHKEAVKAALDRKFNELEGMPGAELERLKTKYPAVFAGNRKDDLEKTRQWIESKEVDVVVNVEGRGHYFIEVKNYRHPLDQRTLIGGHQGKKSVLDQQVEMVELLHFLGLERKYIPAIFFLKGITDDAKELLEDKGVLVITDGI